MPKPTSRKQKFTIVNLSKQKKKEALLHLTSEIKLSTSPQSTTIQKLINYSTFAEEHEFLREIGRIISKERTRSAIMNTVAEAESLHLKPHFRTPSLLCSLKLQEENLRQSEAQLIEFVLIRASFESNLIHARYDQALKDLEFAKEVTGETYWRIRCTLLTLAMAGRIEEMSTYAERCKVSVKDKFSSFIINCMMLLATDPILHCGKIVSSTIDELRHAGSRVYADLLTLLFVPTAIEGREERLTCSHALQKFPLIDQFVLLGNLLAHNTSVAEDFDRRIGLQENSILSYIQALEERGRPSPESIAASSRAYEIGAYHDVIHLFDECTNSNRPPICLASVRAKAERSLNIPAAKQGISALGDLVGSLNELYRMEAMPNQASNSVRSLAIQMNGMSFSTNLELCLFEAMPHHFMESSRSFAAKKASARHAVMTPWSRALADQNDPVLNHKYLTASPALPKYREVKAKIREIALNNHPNTDNLDSELEKYGVHCPLKRDYNELASSAYLMSGQYDKLIKLCAESLAANPSHHTSFPLTKLVAHIERESLSSVDSLIVLHTHAKYVDPHKEYALNEAFEDFMSDRDATRPSQLFSEGQEISRKDAVLLKDIATTDTMDFLGTFDGSNDARAERIRILDFLLSIGMIPTKLHRKEVDELVGLIVVDSCATEFSANKISVNDNLIKRKLNDEVSSMLQLYKSSTDNKEETLLTVNSDNETDDGLDIARAVVAGDKNTTLFKMLSAVSREFLYDEKLGLDKNLSAEIRHGFFSNLMRSKLDEKHLLTEEDSNGEFQKNEYWSATHQLLIPEIVQSIDDALQNFSRKFYKLIDEAEEWMKVTSDASNTERAFNFSLYAHEFQNLRPKADTATNAEELIDLCLELLWKTTEYGLTNIRERLNVDLKSRIDRIFDELIADLDNCRKAAPLSELFAAIHSSKNGIREDISTIAEWFKRSGSTSMRPLSISELIDVSIECYARVRRLPLNISNQIDPSLQHPSIDGVHMKYFVTAVLNIIENSLRHSGFGAETSIDVQGSSNGRDWWLSISNPISNAVLIPLNASGLSAIQERIGNTPTSEMIRGEGGTGLIKVVNHLSSISDRLKLSVTIRDCNFEVRIEHSA
ncbi:hypothetical protein D3C81_694780 [compost metagenome]